MIAGISTASIFSKCMLEDMAPILRGCGTDTVEVFLNTSSEYEPRFASELAGRYRDAGLSCYSVHAMSMQFEPQLFSIHPRQYSDAIAVLEKVLTAAEFLGATHYTMHGAAVLSNGAQSFRMERIIPRFHEICRRARAHGVTVCLENVSWCFYQKPEFALAVQQAMDTTDLKFCLDVKQAVRIGQDPLAFVATLGTQIENVHLCDYYKRDGSFCWALPGQGEYDFSSLSHALKGAGYKGPVFVEVYDNAYNGFDALGASYAYIKRIFA